MHSFGNITQLIIRNIDYPTLGNIELRLKSCDDRTISLLPGEKIVINHTGSKYTYYGCTVQQVDFNKGGANVDLNSDWTTDPGIITYKASYSTELIPVIDVLNSYIRRRRSRRHRW